MVWHGDVDAFVGWCVEAVDLNAYRAALASVPADARSAVVERLAGALASAGGEATRTNLRTGAPLVERLTTPAALLRRQIRLEKLRLLGEFQ